MRSRIRSCHALRALIAAAILAGAGAAADGVLRGASVQPAGDPAEDWLVGRPVERTEIREEGRDLILTNGLVRRVFRRTPNAATTALDNLMTGASVLRAVRPEARVTLNGVACDVGGLIGQPDHAYLLPEWIDAEYVQRHGGVGLIDEYGAILRDAGNDKESIGSERRGPSV